MLQTYKNLAKETKKELILKQANLLDINLAKKILSLNSSIRDAQRILTEYKLELSTLSNPKNNCLTPLQESKNFSNLFYKREDLTTIKAYKIRGAFYQMKKLIDDNAGLNLNFIAASTGNHALGVLKAAKILKVSSVIICVSKSITDFKREKLEKRISSLRISGINAKLIVFGENFDETNEFAKNLALADALNFYIDPYNNEKAMAGQGTIGLEILEQLNEKFKKNKKVKELVVVAPIGGGGLLSGISCALKTEIKKFQNLKDLHLKIIGIGLKDLNSIYGDAIKVKNIGSETSDFLSYFLDKKLHTTDFEMKKAIDFVFQDIGAFVEGASAATLKVVLDKLSCPDKTRAVVCVLSGGNLFGL